VARLELAWEWKTGEQPLPQFQTTPGAFENTPIMIDNVVYLSTPYNRVVALDAETGRELWAYDPKAYEEGPVASGQGFIHRGVAGRRQAPHLHQQPLSPRQPRREDGAAGGIVRRSRRGRHRREPGVADSEEALLEHVAADRLQGSGDPRQRRRRSADVSQRPAGRRARVQRQDGEDGLELPHHPAEGRVRQRDVGQGIVGVYRPHQRLGA